MKSLKSGFLLLLGFLKSSSLLFDLSPLGEKNPCALSPDKGVDALVVLENSDLFDEDDLYVLPIKAFNGVEDPEEFSL